jgi:polyhydroxybutyrate depolymerase
MTKRTKRGVWILRGIGLLFVGACLALAVLVRWISGPSSACRRPATGTPEAGLSARTLESGGSTRCYLLYVPAGLPPDRPAMLVVSLHGFASRPEGQVFLTGWNELADREGFLVVYPQGTGFPVRWNTAPQFNLSGADDARYVRDVIDDTSRLWSVDPTRIFLNGMSNGGAMAHRLACEMADRVAAVGIVAGPNTDPPEGCRPVRPVPVQGFYGTADPLVSYEGGTLHASFIRRLDEDVAYAGAQDWIAGWAERDGCSAEPRVERVAADVTRVQYDVCEGQVEVMLYTVQGGGHTWPGGPDLPYLGPTTGSLNASEEMLAFYDRHPMPDRLGPPLAPVGD